MGKWYSGRWPTDEEMSTYKSKINASYACPCGSVAKFRCTSSIYIISCRSCGREASDYNGNWEGTPDEAIKQWFTDEPLTSDEERLVDLRIKTKYFRQETPLPKDVYMGLVDAIWKSDKTPKEKSAEWDSLYIDQAMRTSYFYDRKIFSAYTPYGVKEIESWFARRIQEIGTERQWVRASDIEKLLLRCPHLHIIFKSDLYSNLSNYRLREVKGGRIRKRQYESDSGPFSYLLQPGAWKRHCRETKHRCQK